MRRTSRAPRARALSHKGGNHKAWPAPSQGTHYRGLGVRPLPSQCSHYTPTLRPPSARMHPPGHAHGSLSLPSTYHVHAHLALDGAVAPPLLTNAQSVSVQALISVPYERGRERVPSGLRRPARRAPRTPASLPHLLSPRASGSFHGLPPPPPGASLPPLHVVTALRLLYRAYCIAPTASCCCRRPPPPRAARRRRWRAPARSAPRLR